MGGVSGDDWQAGDLALCVRQPRAHAGLVRSGGVYTVAAVAPFVDFEGEGGLAFEGITPPPASGYYQYWAMSRFRKIRPHVPDAEDRETIALLTDKPAKVGA